jgi:hypothetical protein
MPRERWERSHRSVTGACAAGCSVDWRMAARCDKETAVEYSQCPSLNPPASCALLRIALRA